MTFKIGDDIIMTADSKRGDVYSNLPDGDYQGKIIGQCDKDHVDIDIPESSVNFLCFNLKGSCPTYPGLSIRLAEEEPIGRNVSNGRELEPTPSQWIEGKAPPAGERTGGVFIGKHGWEKPVYYGIDEIIRIEKYTHWQYVQLPSPPPVKEVKAYGFLECVSKAKYNDFEYIEKARRFYSQLATAENIEKYFTRKEKEYNLPSSRANNIDEYIAQSKGYALLFTPAALEELGVK